MTLKSTLSEVTGVKVFGADLGVNGKGSHDKRRVIQSLLSQKREINRITQMNIKSQLCQEHILYSIHSKTHFFRFESL